MPKQPVTIEDLFAFSTLSGVLLSPDGHYAAFQTSTANEDSNGYNVRISLCDMQSGTCRFLTRGPADRIAYWEPDGTLVFTSKRKPLAAEEKEPLTRFYRIRPEGGEAQSAFDVPENVLSAQWISDDLVLVHAFRDFSNWDKQNYQVFEEIPFWLNGKGFSNRKRPSLLLFTPSTGESVCVTGDRFETAAFALSPDRAQVLYCGADLLDVKTRRGGLFLYDIAAHTTHTLIDPQTMCVEQAAFFDARTVFFTVNLAKDSHSNALFYRLDIPSGTYAALPSPDIGITQLKSDGGHIYLCADDWGASRLSVLSSDGEIRSVPLPEGLSIQSFDVLHGQIVFTGEEPNSLQELYLFQEGVAVRASTVNRAFEASREILPVHRFMFTNRAGITLEGFVLRPSGYEEGKRYPGLLEIHGGPKVSYGAGFNHEMQAYAAAGYFVFFCNPRGSSGRGSEFAGVTGKLGTIDYEDIMDFTDEVLRREPGIDSNRLGVLGGSYGGFMTNWIIGHTDRFAAACSQRSISNYVTKCLTTDIGHYHNLSQMTTDPWKDFHTFWDHSPLKYADRCKTPTLFIHSDHDFRCWMSEGIQMHQALRRFGVETKLCLFTEENHELSRSGRPKGRLGRLREMLDWFDSHLKNQA